MAESKSTRADTQTERPKANGQPKRQPRVISSPKDVAQLVMIKIDHVNAKKTSSPLRGKGWLILPDSSFWPMRCNKTKLPSSPKSLTWKRIGPGKG